jgi:hypothetical protein
MNITDALTRVRALQADADDDWPVGYDSAHVLAEATALLAILDAEATTRERARELVAELEYVELEL